MRGVLDVLMLALPLDEPEVETTRLFDDPFVLAVAASDPRTTAVRVDPRAIEREPLILLEEGHCLRDQALAYCAGARGERAMSLGATSLTTVMQMVANGYGVTLLPQVAAEVEARDPRIKLLRFARPGPGRTIGLAYRRTSPRKADFSALGALITETLGIDAEPGHGSRAVRRPRRAGAVIEQRAARRTLRVVIAGLGQVKPAHDESMITRTSIRTAPALRLSRTGRRGRAGWEIPGCAW